MAHHPTIAVVFLQPDCNMTCTFCVTEETFHGMTFAQALALLDVLALRGITSIVIGGGEPFAWSGDVVRLATVAHERGFQVQVGTNGVALPDGFEQLTAIDRYVLPLESMHAETHDGMRRYHGRHHAIILDRLQALKRARKSVTLSTVVTADNVRDVVEVGAFLRDYHRDSEHVHAWHLYRFLPIGRGGAKHAHRLDIAEADYLQVVRDVRLLALPFRVFARPDMYGSRTVEFFWYEGDRLVIGSDARRDPTNGHADGSPSSR